MGAELAHFCILHSNAGVAGGSAISPEGWRFLICADQERCVVDKGDGVSQWYRRLWEDPAFRASAAARWQELRAGVWADDTLGTMLNDGAGQVRAWGCMAQ
jgi:hypothetical protein